MNESTLFVTLTYKEPPQTMQACIQSIVAWLKNIEPLRLVIERANGRYHAHILLDGKDAQKIGLAYVSTTKRGFKMYRSTTWTGGHSACSFGLSISVSRIDQINAEGVKE